MARQFTVVVDGIPEVHSASSIKATLNLGLRKVMGSRIARMTLPKDVRSVMQHLEIKHLEEITIVCKSEAEKVKVYSD